MVTTVIAPKTGRSPALGRKVVRCCVVVTFLVTLVRSSLLEAQPRDIRFDHLSLEQGLAQEGAYTMLQDSQGFLWIGTQEGLSRWDGYAFTTFRHDETDPGSISEGFVRSILEDRSGVLWAGTLGGGVNIWDPVSRTFRHLRADDSDPNSLSSDRVTVLLEDRSGNLWIGTDGGGLHRRHPTTGVLTRFTSAVHRFEGRPQDRVRDLWEDDDGILWVGTDGAGLLRFDPLADSFLTADEEAAPFQLKSSRIRSVFEARDGWMWVGTYEDGLFRARRDTGEVEHYRHREDDSRSLSSNRVRAILQDEDGTVWVGTDAGINEWDSVGKSFWRYTSDPGDATSLSSNNVLSVYQDRGGVLWFGTLGGGVSRFNPRADFFAGRDTSSGEGRELSSNAVTSFAEDADGNVWIGTYGGGINRLDRRSGRITHYRATTAGAAGLNDDRVMSLFIDSADVLWAGTRASGLNRLDAGRRSFSAFRHSEEDSSSLSRDGVTALTEAHGDLWVGTFEGGLDRLDRESGRFEHFRHRPSDPTSLSNDRVIALYPTASGMWVGTEGGGLNRLDLATGEFTHYRHEAAGGGLGSDVVYSVFEGHDGVVWVGTRNGLDRLDPISGAESMPRIRHYGEADGLANKQVFGILEDQQGRLWLTTTNGLARFDPRSETFRNHDMSHGLLSNEFNSGAYFRTSNGEMFVGGSRGLNRFFPRRARSGTVPPPVVLTRFQKLNRDAQLDMPLAQLDHVELTHRDYVIAFEFAALDFTAPEKNLYSYKLEGFDRDWVEASNIRRATYTNLDSGSYVFRVRAANNFGVWNDDGVAVAITVIPPPWRSWWAYALYVCGAALALGLLVRSQTLELDREAEHRHELERQVELRTRELELRNRELDIARGKFEEASLTDPLTGLNNRRYIANTVLSSLAQVERYYAGPHPIRNQERPDLAFFICDLDRLKEVNDKHGHAAGNHVIVQVARQLESACRKSDTLVRWGGDEFLIMGRCSDVRAAEDLAERIRAACDRPIELPSGSRVDLSCSVGFACYPFFRTQPDAIGWEHVVSIADRALYVAKRSGSNAWAGILGTRASAASDKEDLVALIDDRAGELFAEGRIQLRSSLRDRAAVVWARTASTRQ